MIFDIYFNGSSFSLLTCFKGSKKGLLSTGVFHCFVGVVFYSLALCILGQATKTTFVDKTQHICSWKLEVMTWKQATGIQSSHLSHNLFMGTLTLTASHRLSPPGFASNEFLWTVKGFKENVKARPWEIVAICDIRNDGSLYVCACCPLSEVFVCLCRYCSSTVSKVINVVLLLLLLHSAFLAPGTQNAVWCFVTKMLELSLEIHRCPVS